MLGEYPTPVGPHQNIRATGERVRKQDVFHEKMGIPCGSSRLCIPLEQSNKPDLLPRLLHIHYAFVQSTHIDLRETFVEEKLSGEKLEL